MGRLIGTNTQGATVVLELAEGLNTIGRNPGNSLPLDEPSISGFHCQVSVGDGRVVIKDLGSTNGTFVEGRRIGEAPLSPGQSLQLGSVPLVYQAEALSAEGAGEEVEVPPAAGEAAAVMTACRHHPQTEAQWRCSRCGQFLCTACTQTRQGPTKTWRLCRTCQGDCQAIAVWIAAQQPAQRASPQGFFRRLPSAFAYPFTRGGTMLLIGGTVLFSLINAARFVVPFAGVLGLVAAVLLFVFSFGYLFAYMQRILSVSAHGEDDIPDWPEFTDWGSDIVRPCLMFFLTLAVSFGAPVGYLIYQARSGEAMNLPIIGCLAAFGGIYFPMALVAVALSDNFFGVNPLVVLPTISKIPGQYAVAVLIFFLLVAARYFGEVLVRAALPVPLLPGLLVSFIALYFLTVEMRILGLMYYTNRERFAWFRD